MPPGARDPCIHCRVRPPTARSPRLPSVAATPQRRAPPLRTINSARSHRTSMPRATNRPWMLHTGGAGRTPTPLLPKVFHASGASCLNTRGKLYRLPHDPLHPRLLPRPSLAHECVGKGGAAPAQDRFQPCHPRPGRDPPSLVGLASSTTTRDGSTLAAGLPLTGKGAIRVAGGHWMGFDIRALRFLLQL
uniref:Uncharacterized protein n=1 Tax=Oryza meridionalis TaxID=40149 RepID=A0A0E0DP40_9ORYZ